MPILAIHKNVAFWFFRGPDQLLRETIFLCYFRKDSPRPPPPPPFGSAHGMDAERSRTLLCRAWSGSNCLHKKSFWISSPKNIINVSTSHLTLFRCRSSPTFLCRAWSWSKLFAKVIINFFKGEAWGSVKGIRHQDMYPFLYKILRYKIYKIKLVRLKICIRISTSGSRSGPINSVAGG